jgi:predicted CoA-substrate-specific enzyme activase
MITCGIDIGSSTIEVVLLGGASMLGRSKTASGAFPAAHAKKALDELLTQVGIGNGGIGRTVATGFGRNYFVQADRSLSEITCHAAGVFSLMPSARTIIEIGGQDSKMMQLDERGRVTDFVMNDRCAAGTGKFIETVARTLAMAVEDTGALGLRAEKACEISSMCAVFAETEIVGLLHQGASPASVLRGVFNAVSRRILGMSARIGLKDEIIFTGGVARNPGVHKALEEVIGRKILVPSDPEYTGALGAALIASRGQAADHRITSHPLREASC